MGILTGMWKREADRQAPVEEPEQKGGSYAEKLVSATSPTAALSVAAFYRGVELRAQTMSQLKLEYQRRNDTYHGGNYEAAYETRGGSNGKKINYLVQVMPNPTMTWPQLMRHAEEQRILEGNAYVYVEREIDGEIRALWLCSQGRYNMSNGTYDLEWKTPQLARKSGVKAADVIHLRNSFSTDGGLTGVSTLHYASKALTLAATNDRLVMENAAKGGRVKLIVQENKEKGFGLGKASTKQMKEVAKTLNDSLYTQDVVFMSNVAQITPISQSLQDQNVQIARQFSVDEIGRFLGEDPCLLGVATSNYKSPEAAMQDFLQRTISPLINEWETELNAKLLGPECWGVFRYHFNDESLMRMTPVSRANIDKVLLECGVKCVNELRDEYDLPAVKGGDTHYISTNLAELGSDKLSKKGDEV